jgi:CheY-like chemotaxis protein
MTTEARVLIADASRHVRSTICEILRNADHRDLVQAASGAELCERVDSHRPRVVITASNLPDMSGLQFARLIRGGLNFVPRETSIILSTDTPTRIFLEAARSAGVDEVVAIPFTTKTLMARLASVLERPRRFVDCASYVGPCRRRLMLQDYKGPMRRASDPVEAPAEGSLWSLENNRSAVRLCVQKMSEYRSILAPEPYKKLRAIYLSVMKLETRTDQANDDALGEAAKCFGRYMSAIGVRQTPDLALLNDHIDCLHTLALDVDMTAEQKLSLIAGLQFRLQAKITASEASPS